MIALLPRSDEHRQVQLLGDVGGLGDQHAVDGQFHAGGLVGGHLRAEHALGVVAHFIEGLGELHAAGLAAAARVDLGLDHPEVAADGLGRVDSLFRRARYAPGRHRNAVIGKELLCLVFVEIHASPRGKKEPAPDNRGQGGRRARGSIVADRGGRGQNADFGVKSASIRRPEAAADPAHRRRHRAASILARATSRWTPACILAPPPKPTARCVASCTSSPCIACWKQRC